MLAANILENDDRLFLFDVYFTFCADTPPLMNSGQRSVFFFVKLAVLEDLQCFK